MNERVKSALGWVAIAAFMLACCWGMFGRKILMRLKYASAEMSYEVRADEKCTRAARSRVNGSLLWKAYFASVPTAENDRPLIDVSLGMERKLFGPPITSPNRYNSNGHVKATLMVTERGRRQPIYAQEIQYKLPAAFTFTAQSTGNGQEDVFLDTERNALNEITAYLEIAAMRAMQLRPENAEQYAPVVVTALDHNQLVISRAAAQTLCKFGSAAECVRPQIEKIAGKKLGTARLQAEHVLRSLDGK